MYKEHVQDLLFLHIWPFFEMYQMQQIIFNLPPIGDIFRLYAIVCFTHCPEDPLHSKTTLIQSTELRVNSTLTFKEKSTQIKNLKSTLTFKEKLTQSKNLKSTLTFKEKLTQSKNLKSTLTFKEQLTKIKNPNTPHLRQFQAL